jgi:signal transduction histidine kinase
MALLGRQVARAMAHARQYEAQHSARAQAEAAEKRASFLADATTALTSSLDYLGTMENVVRLAVPYLADGCTIDVPREGAIVRLAAADIDPSRQNRLRTLLETHPIDPEGPHPIACVMRTGEAELVTHSDSASLARFSAGRGGYDLAAEFPLESYIVVPLVAGERILGTITLGAMESGRRFRSSDLALAENLAHRAALAIENARLYEEARQAVRMRDKVLAVVSHDLRNPLGAIACAAALLETPSLDPRARKRCEVIRRNIEGMTRLIDDLLDFAAMGQGRLSLRPESCDVRALADEALSTMHLLAGQKQLRLDAELPDNPCELRCDRTRVLQVLSNILGNAVKFTKTGSVSLRVLASARDVRFEITDTGPGIAREDLASVFEPYWQAAETSKHGRGLGLAIARQIVEAHAGQIGVESEPGAGSTFFFVLPR